MIEAKQVRTEKIDSIIASRKESANKIANIQSWMWNARTKLEEFRTTVKDMDLVSVSHEVICELVNRSSAIESDLSKDSMAIEKVRSHFAKDTLAVAVVGQAGMGKSTFLQSLTGLSNDQIPVARGSACTSTQSQIDNLVAGPGYAEVFYYSRAELLSILSDYYSLMKWPSRTFSSLDDFVQDFDKHERPFESALQELWELLKTYQENAEVLEREIFMPNKRSNRIPLEKVSENVTYVGGKSRPENLGIARVEIHCKFPCEDVGKLSVVDTPGMNAASEGRDKIILESVLNDTADFILFIGIPDDRKLSQKEREMFDNCCRFSRQVSDVPLKKKAFYIANQAIKRDENGAILRNGTDAIYNNGWEEAFSTGIIPANRLLKVDVKDSDAVRTEILDPMIDYLVTSLPKLDGEELSAAQSKVERLRNKILELANDAYTSLGLANTVDQDVYRKLRRLFDGVFPSFSAALKNHVEKLAPKKDEVAEDDRGERNPFTLKVSEVYEDYKNKIGIILSKEKVLCEMNRAPGQGGAAFFNLLSYLRCYLRECFSGLEGACHDMVESAKADISAIFVAPFPDGGGMGKVKYLRDSDGNQLSGTVFFHKLGDICKESTEPNGCKNLAKQIAMFETFELRFSGFLEHKVSAALTPLRQGLCDRFLDRKVDYTDAKDIRDALLSLAEKAVNNVACSLVQQSAAEPNEAIFAVLEKFVDQTLRTEGMVDEWINLYEVIRAEVWPEVFDPNSVANRNTFALRKCVDALKMVAKQN